MLSRLFLFLSQLAINAVALLVVDRLFTHIKLDTWQTAVAAGALLALVNTYLRPLIVVLTLPLNILTLGLFTLVINAGLLKLVSWFLPGFHVTGFWPAVGATLVISVVGFLLNVFIKPKTNFRVTVIRD